MATGKLVRRVAAVPVAAALMLLVAKNGIASIASPENPKQLALAHQFAPNNARVLTAVAASRMLEIQDPKARADAKALATRALRRDVTAVGAMAVLGTVASAERRDADARRFMIASASMSKRDLTTRLWFIEEAVQREDVAGALRHFDIALRTSTRSSDILFPVLGQALDDDALVKPVTDLLRTKPAWANAFLYSAINSGVAMENVGRVYAALDPKPTHAGQDLGKLLIEAMIAHRKFDAARNLNNALVPGASKDALINDPAFGDESGYPPFDWSFPTESGVDVARDRDGHGSGLAVEGTSFDSVVASQLLTLTPGTYAFANSVSDMESGRDLNALWTLTCAEGQFDTQRLNVPVTNETARAQWSVPAGCSQQWLRLTIQGGDGLTHKRIMVRPVTLRRLAS